MAAEDWLLARARVAGKMHGAIKLDDKMTFFQQLSSLVSSGTPLLQALQITAEQCQSRRLRDILDEIAGRVSGGCSLRDAMLGFPNVFEPHWIELVGTGEVSGKMASVLDDLNCQVRESRETRRKISGSLMYPFILLIVSIVVIIVMLWVVVPTFAAMFEEMGAELPAITQYVLAASNFVGRWGIYATFGVVCLGVGLHQYLRTESGRRRSGAIGLALPIVGDFMVQSAMYRFSTNLALLLKSGVPILDTLDALANVFRANPNYRDAILQAQGLVSAGRPLAESLEESALFTNMMTNMVKVGEESAQLAHVMEQIAPYYKDKMNSFMSKVTRLMEPCIIVFMGTTVAVVMLAIYIPMFEMSGKVN